MRATVTLQTEWRLCVTLQFLVLPGPKELPSIAIQKLERIYISTSYANGRRWSFSSTVAGIQILHMCKTRVGCVAPSFYTIGRKK